MAGWVTISSLSTAGGTPVLAGVPFASVRWVEVPARGYTTPLPGAFV